MMTALLVMAQIQAYAMSDYWPKPEAGKPLSIHFDSGRLDIYRRDGDDVTLDDTWPESKLIASRWHLRREATGEVVEFEDEYPKNGALAGAPLMPGHGITWGKSLHVGDRISHSVAYTGAAHPFGLQTFVLAQHFDTLEMPNGLKFSDVIKLEDEQKVCTAPKMSKRGLDDPLDCTADTYSVVFYLARGYGIVEIQSPGKNGQPTGMAIERATRVETGGRE